MKTLVANVKYAASILVTILIIFGMCSVGYADVTEQVWSATMTVGTQTRTYENGKYVWRDYGYIQGEAGSISDANFTYRGTTYTVKGINMSRSNTGYPTNIVKLSISPGLPGCDALHLQLYVDFRWHPLAVKNSTYNYNRNEDDFFMQSGKEFDWHVGDQFAVVIRSIHTVPDAPILTGINEENQVTLSWDTPCDGGKDITRHEYRQKIGNGAFGPWIPIPNSAAGEANATSYTVLNVNNPLESTFEVRAENALGVSLPSGFIRISERTPQVRDAIVAAVPGVNSAADVTEAHLAAITTLRVNAPQNQPVRPINFRIGDFSGLTTLTNLEMERWSGVSLPDSIFEGLNALEKVSLYNSVGTSIPNSVLGLASLKSLNLGYHGITSIPAGAFDRLTQLNTLTLDAAAYANTFTSLPDGVFDQLTSLTRLNLDQNKITSLPDGVFDQLTSLESLSMARIHSLSSLPADVFDQLTSLTILSLQGIKPTSLPDGIFSGLSSLTFLDLSGGRLTSLPAGIFSGLSSLTSLYLGRNAVDPLPLTVSLEKFGEGQFKAVAPTGAPFEIVVPVNVRNGSISGGANTLTILKGNVESASLTVTRTTGTTAAVTVDIGTLPELPTGVNSYGASLHQGYTLVKSIDSPIVIISRLTSGISPISERTPQVRDAIVAAVPGVNSANDVTEAHLAAITALDLNNRNITTLKVGDFDGLTGLEELRLYGNQLTTLPEDIFDGLTALTTLRLYGNQLSSLPEDIFDELISLTMLQLGLNQFTTLPSSIFDGLTKLTDLRMIGNQFSTLPDGIFEGLTAGLTTLYLGDNAVDPLPLTVTLEKIGTDQIKVVIPTGAPFDLDVNLRVPNGSLNGGTTSVTIPAGSTESEVLTVTRTHGASGAVSVWIGFLPSLPANHSGYRLANATGEFNRLIIFDDISEQVWSGTVIGGTWGNDFNNGNATGRGYSRHYNAGSISNPNFTYRGTTYTIHGISFSYIGNNLPHQFSLLISPSFPACDQQYLTLNGIQLSDAGLGGAYGASWYLWRQQSHTAWPVGHQRPWKITLHPTVPDAPGVAAINEGNQVMLSWETPCDGGIDITRHEYRQKIGNGAFGPWILIPNSATGEVNATSYTVLNVNNPLESTFEVRAENALGVSLPSAETIPVSAGFIPVSQRTPQVRDAIVAAVAGVNSAADVTETHLAAIRFLNLQRKNIIALKTGDFDGLSSLITLNLTYNDLTTLPAGVFPNLSSLRSLLLYGNDLASLPAGIFDDLSSLTELNLYNNDLTSLPAGIFDNLLKLTTLSLGSNQLTTLSMGIFDELSSLTSLYLGDGQLATLPAGVFTGLSSLTELWLHGNQLTTLSVNAFSGLSSLTRLWLQNNSTNPLSVAVSLELVDESQFKAVAPAGAPFDFVLQISTANGTITGGATSITIPQGSVESDTLTIIRTAGTTAAVTADIGTLPGLPTNVDPQDRPLHQGYTLVKSADLPLEVISATAPQVTGINIPDANLRAKIESALGKTSGDPITATEMATLTSLNAQNGRITNLTGLEAATNLTTLNLGNNSVSDISALIGLTSLTELHLWDNQIANLSALSGLTNLTKLYLWGNSISDISHLSGLTNLRQLRIGENSISNISTVSRLTNLTYLSVKENAISDISAVSELTNLAELVIGNNTISDITPVQNLTNLEWLDMPNNRISDISAVQNLTQLVELYFQNNSVSDLSPLVTNTGLGTDDELDVRGNPLSYPSIYTHIPALQARNVYVDFDNRVATAPVKISGDTQQGNTGATLTQPFIVEVQDGSSVAFAGVPVTFAVTSGGGSLSATNTTTDVNGRAETTLTLGNTAGTNTVRVSITGITQTITFTATATTTPVVTVSPIINRTSQVRDAIIAALPGVNSANDVTEAHLATLTGLDLSNKNISTLKVGDFDGMSSLANLYLNGNQLTSLPENLFAGLTSLTQINLHTNRLTSLPKDVFSGLPSLTQIYLRNNRLTNLHPDVFSGLSKLQYLYLDNNQLTSLPAGVFSGLSSLTQLLLNNNQLSMLPADVFRELTGLTMLRLQANSVAPMPLPVSLEKVGVNQFKATAPAGAPFAIVLPVSVANGSISGGTTTLTIQQGEVESVSLTVTRTVSTTVAVTVDIGTVPGLPAQHQGYELVKSANLPLTIFSAPSNSAPVFTDGTSTTRTIAENTAAGINIGTAITATDADNDTLTYTLGGTDAAAFNVDSNTGQLKTRNALDYETKTSYTVTITVTDGSLTDTITVTINITDIADTPIAPTLTPVRERTSQVREAILGVVRLNFPTISDYDAITKSHLSGITTLYLNNQNITSLKVGDFDDLIGLEELRLNNNQLATLPDGIFNSLTSLRSLNLFNNQLSRLPAGIFEGLTSLTTLRLGRNVVDPFPLTVSLQKAGEGQFKAVVPTGAPFDIVLPLSVANGSITGGATTLIISHGSVESDFLTVTATPGTTAAVTVDIRTLPSLPRNHYGYALVKSEDLPLAVISGINTTPTFTEGTRTTRTVAENTAAAVNIGTPITATDAENDTLIYSLSGADASTFDIDSSTGQLKTKAALDYETKANYTVTITVSDGSFTDTITVTINITDINEAPTPTAICEVGDILAPGESCTYPGTDAVFSVLDNGNSKWNIPNYPWLDKISVGGSMSVTLTLNDENYHFVAKGVSNNSWEIEEIGDDTNQQPDTPEQPGDTGGTPTLTASTAAPLTEATLHGGIITFNLSDGTFERSSFKIRDAITLTGISGATVDTFGVDRVSDTQATVELEYDGNMTANSTLTISLGADAIKDYDGTALTSQLSVPAVSESVAASTAAPLTEATLDESVITLTLSGRKFERSNSTIRSAVSVSGISGVTVGTYDIDRESDTEITVELTFSGNLNTDSTLTFTVGAGAITGYNGPALTAQVSVSASDAPVEIDDRSPDPPVNDTPAPTTDTREAFEASTPAGYTRVTLTKTGRVWGIPTQYTTDSDVGTVAYMALAKLTDCNFADAEVDRRSIVYIKRQSLGQLNSFASETVCGKTSSTWSNAWDAVRIIHLRFYDETGFPNIKEAVYNAATDQIEIPGTWQPPDEPTINDSQDPDPSEQPGENTDRTPTPTTSTTAPLTEATLNGGGITLSLDDQIYELSVFKIRNAMSVAGIPGVTIDSVERVSDMEIAVTLTFNGNIDTDATLTFTVNAGAIVDYTGPAFTAQTSVPAVTESIVASTAAPLTEAALDESIITLTLSGRKFESSSSKIRGAVSVSGISGVTVRRSDIDRESDTEVAVELTFNGNLNTDGTLTLTVGAGAIAGYNGPTLTAQVSVSAGDAPDDTTPAPVDTTPVEDDTTPGVCKVGDVLAPGESCTYPGTDTEFSVLDNGNGQFLFLTSGSSLNIKNTEINGESYTLVAKKLNSGSWEIEEIGDSGDQQPETPQQPGDKDPPEQPDNNTGGTPTLSVTTAAPLTEATLHEGVITFNLSGGTFDHSIFKIRDAITLTGISGVTVDTFGVDRVSDTEATVELVFDGNMTANSTLTISLGADAIKDYDGTALTAQISVSAVTESVAASTAAPLTEATLDESIVTLTLSGRKFERWNSRIRPAVSVSGISGVTVGTFDIDRESDTEITVELTFDGDLTTNGTLTFTVGAGAIAGYNGLALTAQVSVSAGDAPADTGGQNPDPPETPQQPGDKDPPQQPENIGGTPTLSVSTAVPLTEATLHEGVITLTLNGGTFERSTFRIRDAIVLSGISGVTVDTFGVDRVSDTQVTVELAFAGNMTTDSTLTISVGAGAIKDYDGTALTSQISVRAVTESMAASTASPLTEATLDESIVTLTLNGAKYARSIFDIRDAVTVSTGIAGVTVGSFGVRRVSDTKVTVELEFDGTDFDTTSTLTFTVEADAIAGYNGPALTTQVSVTAVAESVVASTASPLTEATLDESVVTLTLSGRTFERSSFKIRGAVTVSGIADVTVGTFDIDKVSDTQITVELTFDGNINTDSTLTFTVGTDAIANYNGSALTTQVTVTADRENVLLANFPNPFNPETWIPYQLAKPTEVTITIYAVNGQVVRRLTLGHQPAGIYQNRSRAAYWDGKNEFGEKVASGLYFYTLITGDFTATRKMLIRK